MHMNKVDGGRRLCMCVMIETHPTSTCGLYITRHWPRGRLWRSAAQAGKEIIEQKHINFIDRIMVYRLTPPVCHLHPSACARGWCEVRPPVVRTAQCGEERLVQGSAAAAAMFLCSQRKYMDLCVACGKHRDRAATPLPALRRSNSAALRASQRSAPVQYSGERGAVVEHNSRGAILHLALQLLASASHEGFPDPAPTVAIQ